MRLGIDLDGVNIQLGEYQSAAVQMLAIAIVVASMDYASSRLRERFT